jgi:hypothetical protein
MFPIRLFASELLAARPCQFVKTGAAERVVLPGFIPRSERRSNCAPVGHHVISISLNDMSMSLQDGGLIWLLLVFSLPAKNASERVRVWRKLRRCGVLPMKSSGYLLPQTATNEERLQWLAGEIRKHKGEASVLQVNSIDDLPGAALRRMFVDARSKEYEAIATELQKASRRRSRPAGVIARLRRRFPGDCGSGLLQCARQRARRAAAGNDRCSGDCAFRQRQPAPEELCWPNIWITRPRPGIDRAPSAWLVRRFVDPNATFKFADNPDLDPKAIPFDMFTGKGFSHRGDQCTFETLIKEFGITDQKASTIAQAVHDADLADGKFGNAEALGIDRVPIGWAHQSISNDELLRRGTEMIKGLYQAI